MPSLQGVVDFLRWRQPARPLVTNGPVLAEPVATSANPSVGPNDIPRNFIPTDVRSILDLTIQHGAPELQRHAMTLKDHLDATGQYGWNATDRNTGGFLSTMLRNAQSSMISTGGVVGINDYGIKGRRQYAAERRRLLDLYVIVLNNADVRTATIHLRNEIFRRGIELVPAFEYRCPTCGAEYTKAKAKQLDYRCSECGSGEELTTPDPAQVRYFRKLSKRCNYFGQSLEAVLREAEDDINIVDDAFIYMRNQYSIDLETYNRAIRDPFNESYGPRVDVKQIFRLDPTLVELDMDARGILGLAHHACAFHRDVLLDVPFDQGWDIEWRGVCEVCGLRTYPIYYKYSEQQAGSFGARRPEVLYLFDNEVIHWSRYSPTETYGYSPVLSFYEKALTLIGMDRYLYDYFFERRVPQGAVAVYTDDPEGFMVTKADVEAKMQRDPHYIPWFAVSAKTQQGKLEYVRFGFSLDELDYLPVRDEIRERIAAIYGVSQIWMSSTQAIGGLNSESQQLVVMSRAVEGAQRSYHSSVFPRLEEAMGVTDWHIILKIPEETAELTEYQIKQVKATYAQTMVGIGFGADYDPDTEEFTFYGKIKSREEYEQEEQQQLQEQQAMAQQPVQPEGDLVGAGR